MGDYDYVPAGVAFAAMITAFAVWLLVFSIKLWRARMKFRQLQKQGLVRPSLLCACEGSVS